MEWALQASRHQETSVSCGYYYYHHVIIITLWLENITQGHCGT